jgi:type III pantothenate kinase
MNILVDVGNTSIKWQFRQDQKVVGNEVGDLNSLEAQLALRDDLSTATAAVSCVRDEVFARELQTLFTAAGCTSVHFVSSVAEFAGLKNAYSVPDALGVDRWLALLATRARGHTTSVVIDAGTACTIDVMFQGSHVGGYILPGVCLARESLIANTDKIRFDDSVQASLMPGTTTAACVSSGAWLMTYGAVHEIVRRFPEAAVFLTGGSARELMALGVEGEWVADLVFEGLDFWINGA